MGVAISVFPTQESYSTLETVTVDEWSLQQHTLPPQDSTFYGKSMEPGELFKLDISSSDSVKVTVSFTQHQVLGPTKVPIFEQTGSSFNQEVPISFAGTYFVDIINENPFSVTLNGNVLVQQKQTKTKYRTIYPYSPPGLLILLGGISALILGIFRKPRKTSKYKGVRKKIN